MLVTKENLKITPVQKEEKNLGVYAFEPLPKGFGVTLGNSLRRVLMTTTKGAAATQVKIAGITHQFSTIKGVKEDTVELTLNLKKIRFALHTDAPAVVTIDKKGPGEVTAKDIHTSSDVDVLNKETHIAHLADNKSELKMEIVVEPGEGYSPMEERQTGKIGVIVLDALFSPIENVIYEVEPARFGKHADLDKLVLTVQTDGSVTPREAIAQAAQTLKGYFDTIISGGVIPEQAEVTEDADKPASKKSKQAEDIAIEELPLQTRTVNALKKHGISTLDQLAKKTDEELADVKNLGEKSLDEIQSLLVKEGLR